MSRSVAFIPEGALAEVRPLLTQNLLSPNTPRGLLNSDRVYAQRLLDEVRRKQGREDDVEWLSGVVTGLQCRLGFYDSPSISIEP